MHLFLPISLILANKIDFSYRSPAIAGPPFRWPENNLRTSPKIRLTSGLTTLNSRHLKKGFFDAKANNSPHGG
jgi:hypothetical protein